jgi:hypothetical protein
MPCPWLQQKFCHKRPAGVSPEKGTSLIIRIAQTGVLCHHSDYILVLDSRSTCMKTLDLDVRFLAAGNVDIGANPLQYFVSAMSLKQGHITAKLDLKVLAAKGRQQCRHRSASSPNYQDTTGLLIPLHQQCIKTILARSWDAAPPSRKSAG